MTGEGQKYPETKDFQRVLAAKNGGTKHRGIERGPARRHETHRQNGEREEMQQAEHVEVGLVDRIDDVAEPARHEVTITREIPSHHDREGEREVSDGKHGHNARANEAGEPFGAAHAAPDRKSTRL